MAKICYADWCLDHDHKTGKARGILCASCNIGLGMFKDDPDILDLATTHLLKDKNILLTGGDK